MARIPGRNCAGFPGCAVTVRISEMVKFCAGLCGEFLARTILFLLPLQTERATPGTTPGLVTVWLMEAGTQNF